MLTLLRVLLAVVRSFLTVLRMFLNDLFGPSVQEVKKALRIEERRPTEVWSARFKDAAERFTAVSGQQPAAFLLAPEDYDQFVNDCRVMSRASLGEGMSVTDTSRFAFLGANILRKQGVPRGSIQVRDEVWEALSGMLVSYDMLLAYLHPKEQMHGVVQGFFIGEPDRARRLVSPAKADV